MVITKKNNSISADNFDKLLAIAGYIYPKNDSELEQFELLYKDYDFKLKDERINPLEIINQSFEKKGNVLRLRNEEERQDLDDIKIAARKGHEQIPQSILDKMKNKHKNGDK